jgi:hypothetical protein
MAQLPRLSEAQAQLAFTSPMDATNRAVMVECAPNRQQSQRYIFSAARNKGTKSARLNTGDGSCDATKVGNA